MLPHSRDLLIVYNIRLDLMLVGGWSDLDGQRVGLGVGT